MHGIAQKCHIPTPSVNPTIHICACLLSSASAVSGNNRACFFVQVEGRSGIPVLSQAGAMVTRKSGDVSLFYTNELSRPHFLPLGRLIIAQGAKWVQLDTFGYILRAPKEGILVMLLQMVALCENNGRILLCSSVLCGSQEV